MFNIVLVAPEIPQNTGTIGRLCVCNGAPLHLIRPLGFSLDETQLRRAGLDYWPHLDLHVHDDWEAFLAAAAPDQERLFFISTKAQASIFKTDLRDGDWLVFGRETSGLPPEFYDRYRDQLRLIPMLGEHCRSLNLANAVSIVFYEALRQAGQV